MRPCKEPDLARSAGFTLIELMISLLLLSLMFLLLTSGLQLGTNVWAGRGKEVSGSAEAMTTQSLLRRVFSETRPVMIEADATRARHVFFVGNETSMRFVTSMPGHLGVGGFYEVLIKLVEGESGNRVEISWQLFRSTNALFAPASESRRAVLLTGVNELQFAYFGFLGKNEPPRWYTGWQNVDHLPDLIRMRVTFTDNEHTWPDLVVAPLVRSLNVIIDPERIMN